MPQRDRQATNKWAQMEQNGAPVVEMRQFSGKSMEEIRNMAKVLTFPRGC